MRSRQARTISKLFSNFHAGILMRGQCNGQQWLDAQVGPVVPVVPWENYQKAGQHGAAHLAWHTCHAWQTESDHICQHFVIAWHTPVTWHLSNTVTILQGGTKHSLSCYCLEHSQSTVHWCTVAEWTNQSCQSTRSNCSTAVPDSCGWWALALLPPSLGSWQLPSCHGTPQSINTRD